MRLRLEQHESESGDYRRRRGVKKALENVQAEHVGHRQLFLASKEDGAHGLTGSAEQKHSRESGKGEFVDGPEIGRSEIFLEDFPTQRAKCVAAVNSD